MYRRYTNNRYRKTSVTTRFLAFFQQYWLVLVFLLVSVVYLFPFLKRKLQDQKRESEVNKMQNLTELSNAQNETNSPTIQKAKSTAIRKAKYPHVDTKKWNELNTNAQKLAFALGTDAGGSEHHLFGQSWLPLVYNQYHEDEAEAVKIVKKHSGTFPILAQLYHDVYTLSRNLKTDLLQYLSKSDLEQIRASHLKHGNFKHI